MKVVVKIKLKEILTERNMTQSELAKLSNLSETVISIFARGQGNSINKEYLSKIASALNIEDIGELLELEAI
ncbi:helix-turn-helix transcriptional regulator [Streptococcus pneumoniae]|nr:helix-turn-helix transcriptional regulator [Streptococcus pneumoniae]VJT95200.1 conjugal transfer protein TrbA [Streptococcus pneumoniae]